MRIRFLEYDFCFSFFEFAEKPSDTYMDFEYEH